MYLTDLKSIQHKFRSILIINLSKVGNNVALTESDNGGIDELINQITRVVLW